MDATVSSHSNRENDTTEHEEPMYLVELWNMALDESLGPKERNALEAKYFAQHTKWKTIQARLVTSIVSVAETEFWKTLCSALLHHGLCTDVGPLEKVEEVVCLCLGKLEDNATIYQLSLLILLLERLNINHEKCFIYDPCHSSRDIDILKHLGFSILQENDNGRIHARQRTLFYMPHGNYDLTDNLISANYYSLNRIAILGNNLAWVCDSEAESTDSADQQTNKFSSRAPYVQKVLKLAKETHLQDTLASNVRSQLVNLAPRVSTAFGNIQVLTDLLDCTLTTFPPTMPWKEFKNPYEFSHL